MLAELGEPNELGSWADDEISAMLPKQQAPAVDPDSAPCPGCGKPLATSAKLCVRCGYDPQIGQQRATQRPDSASKKQKSAAAGLAWNLGRGVAISSIGALLGAIVWAGIAVATQLEIGWVAWAIGAAAGGGMAAGYEDHSDDGFLPGVLAAFIALGGIVLGKVFIVVWVVYPIIMADNANELPFKREVVAGSIAESALKQRGIEPDADEAAWDQEFGKAMASLENVSDEDIDQRFETLMTRAAEDAKAAEAQLAEAMVAGAPAAAGNPAVTIKLDKEWADEQFEQEEESPSLIGLFFSTMFGPMDAVFILLAFFTAYKIGSGTNSD